MPSRKHLLTYLIFAGFFLGIFFGWIIGDPILVIAEPMKELFLRLLKMAILPLVITSIISAVIQVGSGKGLGIISLRTFIYYITTSVLAILTDQHANEAAVRLDFLGRPAWCPKGPAMLALRTKCAVLPGFGVRLPDESLRGYILEEIEVPANGDRETNIAVLMQRINDVIGEQIRQYPEQWLWFHNRWKDLRPDLAKPATG